MLIFTKTKLQDFMKTWQNVFGMMCFLVIADEPLVYKEGFKTAR